MTILTNKNEILYKKEFSIFLLFWFLVQTLLNYHIGFTINIIGFLLFLLKNRGRLNGFYGMYFFILYFIFGSIIGLINYASGTILISDYFRDFLYFLNPFLFLLICNFVYKKYSFTTIINSLLIYAFIYSVYTLFNLGITIFSGNFSISEHTADWNLYFVLVMLLSKQVRCQITMFKNLIPCVIALVFIILLFSFSRTSLFVFIISLVVLCINRKNFANFVLKSLLLFCVICFLLICLSYASPSFKSVMEIFFNKLIRSFTELKSSNVWNEVNITHNWRGYEVHQGILEFSKANVFEKLFGYGWGKGINVGEYSILVVSDRNDNLIPHLHNGYITMLVKFGIFGLILYISFYLVLIYRCVIMINKGYWNYHIPFACTLCYLVTTIFVKGIFVAENPGILMFFMALATSDYKIKTKRLVLLKTLNLKFVTKSF